MKTKSRSACEIALRDELPNPSSSGAHDFLLRRKRGLVQGWKAMRASGTAGAVGLTHVTVDFIRATVTDPMDIMYCPCDTCHAGALVLILECCYACKAVRSVVST